MHITIDRNAFLKALGHVTGIVERRNTIPILSNVLIAAQDGTLTLKATDLDMEATETAPAEIRQPGALTLPAHTLHDIIRKIPDGLEVGLARDQNEGRLNITAGRTRFTLAVLPASDFPDLGRADLPHNFTLSQGDLKRLFEKVRFAISTEETRYYLNGIYLHTVEAGNGRKLRAVATDGHRLAQLEMDCPSGAEDMPGVIVPRKAVGEVIKLLGEAEAPVEVALSQSKVRFSVGSLVMTSKLIDGTFPDYARVIPTANSKTMIIDNTDFVKAVDRVSTLSAEKGRAVKLNLTESKLTLSVTNPESGSAEEELTADYNDAPLEIGFNARYLMDIAAQLDGTRAAFRLADASSPTLVSGEEDSAALYVLMPMRV